MNETLPEGTLERVLLLLAQHICRLPTREARSEFLAGYARHNPRSIERLRELVRSEWAVRQRT